MSFVMTKIKFNQTTYRIQDSEGRGPFKPGTAVEWCESRIDLINLKPAHLEFDDYTDTVRELIAKGLYVSIATDTLEQLRRWFTVTEYLKLLGKGYKCYKVDQCHVAFRSDIQLLIARKCPPTQFIEQVKLYYAETIQ